MESWIHLCLFFSFLVQFLNESKMGWFPLNFCSSFKKKIMFTQNERKSIFFSYFWSKKQGKSSHKKNEEIINDDKTKHYKLQFRISSILVVFSSFLGLSDLFDSIPPKSKLKTQYKWYIYKWTWFVFENLNL